MSLFKRSPSEGHHVHTGIVCDIGSGSIGIAWVRYPERQRPEIMSLIRLPFPLSDDPSYNALLEVMLRTFDTALEHIVRTVQAKDASLRPGFVTCFLSSPWAVSEARAGEYSKDDDIKISPDVLLKVQQAIIDDVKEDLASDDRKTDIIMTDFSRIRLNGYKTSQAEGKVARHIAMTGFVSMSERTVRDRLATIIKQRTSFRSPIFASSTYAYYRGIEQIVSLPPDYVLYDVRSETSDICVIRDNDLVYTASFSLGVTSIYRIIAQLWKTSIVDAEGRLGLYLQGSLSADASRAVKTALSQVQDEWDTYLREFIQEASALGPLPATVLYATLPGKEQLARKLIMGEFSAHSSLAPTSSDRSGMFFDRSGWFHILDIPLSDFVQFPGSEVDPFLALASLEPLDDGSREV